MAISITGRILGVDYGDKRTGLAVSDLSGFLASGIGTVTPGGMKNTAQLVAEKAKEYGAVKIIVGLPKNMDGTLGFRAEAVERFAELLREATPIPVELYDERLTTVVAHTYLSLTDSKKRKSSVDTLSAQIILQNYLDRMKNIS